MEILDAVFYLFALMIVGSASIVVFSKNIMYSAFALLFTLFGVAGLYVLLNADFLAVTQIMIYIGGILILIIFGVMMTNKIRGVDIKTGVSGKVQVYSAGAAVLVLGITMISMFNNTEWLIKDAPALEATIKPIGRLLLTDYLIAFEAASVLLLAAIIGAAMIARRKKA